MLSPLTPPTKQQLSTVCTQTTSKFSNEVLSSREHKKIPIPKTV